MAALRSIVAKDRDNYDVIVAKDGVERVFRFSISRVGDIGVIQIPEDFYRWFPFAEDTSHAGLVGRAVSAMSEAYDYLLGSGSGASER